MGNPQGLSEERKVRILSKGKKIKKYQKEKISKIKELGIESILDECDNDLTNRLMICEAKLLKTQSNSILMQLINVNMIKSTLSLMNVSGIKDNRYFCGLKYIKSIMDNYCHFEEKESEIIHKLSIRENLNKDEKKMLIEIINQIALCLIQDLKKGREYSYWITFWEYEYYYKLCSGCCEVKHISKFSKKADNSDGYDTKCNECRHKKDSDRKECSKCGKRKASVSFGKDVRNVSGLKSICKQCDRESKKKTF
ncbi:MAG: hypothetical protein A2Y24_03395 [Clostridiales bacterium GWE2_32_10]|nr:MAG: hypothetical protein A2Y24_03395 [Clostridiales bacterium GWE2_32_10]